VKFQIQKGGRDGRGVETAGRRQYFEGFQAARSTMDRVGLLGLWCELAPDGQIVVELIFRALSVAQGTSPSQSVTGLLAYRV